MAETVDRRDPRGVELSREVGAPELDEPRTDPVAQLAGRLLGVRDDEERVDVEPALADRPGEPLDEHGRLARAGAGGDEDDPARLDRRRLLGVGAVAASLRDSCSRRSRPLHPAHGREVAPRGAAGVAERVVTHVPAPDARDEDAGLLDRAVDLRPELVLVPVVARREAGNAVLLRRGAQEPAGRPLPREGPVEAAERLDPDEIAEREHVERDLEPELRVDLGGGVGGLARLVVLDDAAGAERVDVDPVDLPGQA